MNVYGISSCTTVRKAKDWLESQGAGFDYANFQKVDGLEREIGEWVRLAGKDRVLNTKAQNFKKLDDATQARLVSDDAFAIAEMAKLPQLIKRPVVRQGDTVLTGFDEAEWSARLTL